MAEIEEDEDAEEDEERENSESEESSVGFSDEAESKEDFDEH